MIKLVFLCALLAGCKSSTQDPDPASFGPIAEGDAKEDPRRVVFYNDSVEMAELELFVPVKPLEDCKQEAPHRLLCPEEYQSLVQKRVYPRSKIDLSYPKAHALECAQVWVRVHSKAMADNEYREALFLFPGGNNGLELELGEGPAARLEQREGGASNRYPPPIRFCGPSAAASAPSSAESLKELDHSAYALATAKGDLEACCPAGACQGVLRVNMTIHRDGTVQDGRLESSKGKVPQDCLLTALKKVRFPGFTPALSTVQITLRLPLPKEKHN